MTSIATSSVTTTAVSGMKAATRRLEVSASNVANISSTGALPSADGTTPADAPQAYALLRVNQSASADGGTTTTLTSAGSPAIAVSDPQAPFANADGLVAAPNVDLSQEVIDQAIATYSFAANAKVLRAQDRMTKSLLDTTA